MTTRRPSFAWTELDLPEDGAGHWSHPGATVDARGDVYVGGSDGHTVHRFGDDGPIESVELGTVECHGLAVDDRGCIWVADPGQKSTLHRGRLHQRTHPGQVVVVDPESGQSRSLPAPSDGWRPTGVALHDFCRGSDGRVWVADGYGAGLVHCFDRDGRLLWTSDGAASGSVFRTPHGIVVDDRAAPPRLLVADRGNRRIVALSLEGEYLGEFGAEALTSPSGLAVGNGRLWVSELFGSVVAFDAHDQVLFQIGESGDETAPGWPNRLVGEDVAPPHLTFGRLRSPHGIAALPSGEVVVAEWLVGGRAIVLSPVRR
jgi:outer membrane protein assembly factor BamB